MSVTITPAAIHAALKSIKVRVPDDSPLLSICVTIALDFQLSATALANKWDTFKANRMMRDPTAKVEFDAKNLAAFKEYIREDAENEKRRKVKKEQLEQTSNHYSQSSYTHPAIAATAAASQSRIVANGGSKRVYTKDTIHELYEMDEMLGRMLGTPTPIATDSTLQQQPDGQEKRTATPQSLRESEHLYDDGGKEERKEEAAFVTPSAPRHRSNMRSSTSQALNTPNSTLSLTPSSASPFTSSSQLAPIIDSKYAQRTDAGKVTFTHNDFLAAAAPITQQTSDTPSTQNEAHTRMLEIELLKSEGELFDEEQKKPFRFMFMQDEDIRDGLADRLDAMQQALLQTHEYADLVQQMKMELGIGNMNVKDEENEATEDNIKQAEEKEEKKEAGTIAMSDIKSTEEDEKKQEEKPEPAEPVVKMEVNTDKQEKTESTEAETRPTVVASSTTASSSSSSSAGNNFGWTDVADNDDDFSVDIGLSSTSVRSQASVIVCGRVCVNANSDDTRLSVQSVQIEGDRGLSRCHRINLRTGLLSSYALFPGQILLAKGVNTDGLSVVAEQIITAAPAPLVSVSHSQARRYNSGIRPLTLIAAAGPFTTVDDLSYAPLFDLVQQVQDYACDVLILQGPFCDVEHPQIRTGACDVRALFQQLLKELSRQIPSTTRVILQPSTRDLHHVPIFPQPPFDAYALGLPINFICVPNPATIRINDVVIGLTSLDVLSHFVHNNNELVKDPNIPKRLPRLASYCVQQASFLPLFPVTADTDCVDYTLQNRYHFTVTPSLLLLPSALSRFAAEIGEDCIGINTGYLTKASLGGQYGLITIHPKSDFELQMDKQSGAARVSKHLIGKRTRVDLMKI